jgi:cation diffusion facilitator family transporter
METGRNGMGEPVIADDLEKRRAAGASVAGALGLTLAKLAAGYFSGSLGILAEAAHSGLDLLAALVTFLAIRLSSRPADRTHLYGHGKVENLSALFEAGLLVFTCGWIAYEAISRLVSGSAQLHVTFWSFAVIVLSIGVDISRSRLLRKTAAKFRSQALEADAIHFETDIWSSAVVLVGLGCVTMAPLVPWLHKADAIAALIVACIVLYVTGQLTMRALHALLDAAPDGLEQRIKDTAMSVPGIADCHQVRMRYVGSTLFADIHVLMDGKQSLRDAHLLTEEVEKAIQEQIPDSDVTVHAEPLESAAE